MKHKERIFQLYLTPAFLVAAVFVGIPIGYTIYLSLQEMNLMLMTQEFIGLKNYMKIWQDFEFVFSLLRTIEYVVIVNAANFVIAFPMALVISQMRSRWRNVLAMIFILPMLLIPVAAATFWRTVMYSPPYAELNRLFGFDKSLLADSNTALLAVMLVDIWGWTPWVFLPLLGGLEGLDSEAVEAAQIDGASVLRIIWSIILPILKPVIIVTLSIKAIGTFRVFNYVWVMTRGGPGTASHTLSTYIYSRAFFGLDYGYGSALAVVMVLCAISLTAGLLIYMARSD